MAEKTAAVAVSAVDRSVFLIQSAIGSRVVQMETSVTIALLGARARVKTRAKRGIMFAELQAGKGIAAGPVDHVEVDSLARRDIMFAAHRAKKVIRAI